MSPEWTPREQRSRDKWRQRLAQFQYENSYSVEEMNAEMVKLKLENTAKTLGYDNVEAYLESQKTHEESSFFSSQLYQLAKQFGVIK